MSERRFTDKPELDPQAVRGLPLNHPAMTGNHTLFPSTVVEVTEEFSDRLLVSGENNRKLGKTITKGKFKGYGLFGLSLEERATCPADCEVRAFCLALGTRVLTADLRWLPIEKLNAGQQIVAFDEYPTDEEQRKTRIAVVEAMGRDRLLSYRIKTDRGEVVASVGHQWLARRKYTTSAGRAGYCWVATETLKPGDTIQYLVAPWEEDRSYDAGRIRGFVEGEGTVGTDGADGYPKVRLAWSQRPGTLLDEINALVTDREFQIQKYARVSGINHTDIIITELLGGWRAAARFLGIFRPTRLIEKATNVLADHALYSSVTKAATVEEISLVGETEVITIQTSTKTLIAEGFCSHNCYGNGMQLARRHRIGDLDLFNCFLEDEIRTILADPIDGMMVRLHVLGDFPSVEYVAMWADLLEDHPKLACYGYTHRRTTKISGGDEIGDAIDSIKTRFTDRFRIRWSSEVSRADSAVVIHRVPSQSRIPEGLVCPAQTDATACCASCGLCWEPSAKRETIVFIKHGPKSDDVAVKNAVVEMREAAIAAAAPEKPVDSETVRAIAGMTIPQKRDIVLSKAPEVRIVSPSDLRVEPAYQRDLSGKSMKLIRKIVIGWDWTKFKPPICAETEDGLFVIDGQHTAIAAASHPEIKTIPVMVVAAQDVRRRAEAFVSHNRDRLTMTPAQIFYGDVASGKSDARAVLDAVTRAGGSIPRLPVLRNYAKAGQITAIGELRRIQIACGPEIVERIIRVAVLAKIAPVSMVVIAGLRGVLTEKRFSDIGELPDGQIAAALASIKNIESASRHYAAETNQSPFRAAAGLIANSLRPEPVREVAE